MKDCNLTVWQAPPCLICQIRHTAFVSSNLDLRKIENFQVHSIMIQQVMLNLHPKSFQSCPTLCDPMDCGPPGSSIHGILQARILDWVALLQGIFQTQGSNLSLLGLHWQSATWEAQYTLALKTLL